MLLSVNCGPNVRFMSTLPMRATLATVLLFVAGCGDSPTDTGPATFRVDVSGETFRVRATDQATVEALEARMMSGLRGVISGQLVHGDGGFNGPWSWHLDPETLDVPDAAIELCDGRPSMVENDLDYWFESVGRFCPWSALVTGREP